MSEDKAEIKRKIKELDEEIKPIKERIERSEKKSDSVKCEITSIKELLQGIKYNLDKFVNKQIFKFNISS